MILLGQISSSASLWRLDSSPEDPQKILNVPLCNLFFVSSAPWEGSLLAGPSFEEIVRNQFLQSFSDKKLS